MDFFANELGGLLFGGAILTTAVMGGALGTNKLSSNDVSDIEKVDEAIVRKRNEPTIGIEHFESLYRSARDGDEDTVILAPKISSLYDDLGQYFAALGFVVKQSLWYLTIDFSPLLEDKASFESERELLYKIFKSGILLMPGEVWGADYPGSYL
jgi:hypothetical protein